MAQCALCLEHRKLKKSHIIPDAYFREIKANNSRVGYAKKVPLNFAATMTQTQESWHERLLCEQCERHFGRLETIYIRALRTTAVKIGMAVKRQELDHFEFNSFRCFLLSILWRASVSKQEVFRQAQLEPSQMELLRKALLEGISPGEKHFPIRVQKVVDVTNHFDPLVLCRCIIPPYRFKLAALEGIRLEFGGYIFEFLMPQRATRRRLELEGVIRDRPAFEIPSVNMLDLKYKMQQGLVIRHKHLSSQFANRGQPR